MRSLALVNRTTIEIFSITGMMALFIYMETRLGILEWAIDEIILVAPNSKGLLIAFVGSLWVGLLTYSYYKRRQSQRAVCERKNLEKELQKQKMVSNISGLPNRAGFERLLNDTQLLYEPLQWTVLAVEISNISAIRSVHGKDVGNKVERHVAEILTELMTASEVVAHDDHSVFYYVVTGESEDEVSFRMDQVVDAISVFVESGIEEDGKALGIKVKYAAMQKKPAHKQNLRNEKGSVAKRLGFALQVAQGSKTASVTFYSEEMEFAMQRRALIETSFGQAVNAGQIAPSFHPLIDLTTGMLSGFEILARWKHPVLGPLMPVDFLSVAEAQGKLADMTLIILEQACDALKNWPEHIKLSINVSPADLQNNMLAEKMIDIIRARDIDPGRFEVEITETAFIEEADNVGLAIARLKEHGMSISIDDFGTGYSSLLHLRLLPFDKIKIDRSFIIDIISNPESLAIVQNIIALGRSLGLPTTAEGVDNSATHVLLQSLDCAMGQGYFYARPLSAGDVKDYIENYIPEEKIRAVA